MSTQSFGERKILEKIKHMKKQDWIAVILIGLLLLIVALPSTGAKENAGTYQGMQEEETLSYRKELEKDLCEILSEMTGVGKVNVMITMKEENSTYFTANRACEVEGVVIVAEGGDNAVVANEILEVVMSLFPVDAHKITIVKMKVSEA